MEDQYSSMSVAALREVAKGRGLRTSGMKKQELIDALIQMEIEDQKEQQEDSNAALKHKPTGDSKQKELTEKITEAVKEKEKPEKSTGKRRISKTVEKSVIETTEDIEKEQIEPQNEIKTEPKLTIPIQEKEEGIQLQDKTAERKGEYNRPEYSKPEYGKSPYRRIESGQQGQLNSQFRSGPVPMRRLEPRMESGFNDFSR